MQNDKFKVSISDWSTIVNDDSTNCKIAIHDRFKDINRWRR